MASDLHNPPYRLKVLSTRILPRLKLLPSFKNLPGLSHEIPAYTERYPEAPWITLWKCLSQGAPLLSMLGFLYPDEVKNAVPAHSESLSRDQRRLFLSEFASTISSLEKRGKILPGTDPFKFDPDKFLDKSAEDIIEVLKVLEQVLREIGRSKPNLSRLPWHNEELPRHRYRCLQRFYEGEVAYLRNIDEMTISLMWLHLQKRPPSLSPSLNLQEVADRMQLIRTFHSNMKDRLEKLLMSIHDIDQWDTLFPSANSDGVLLNAIEAYKIYCDEYPSIVWLLDGWTKPVQSINVELRSSQNQIDIAEKIGKLCPLARGPIDSVLYYTTIISQLVAFTNPVVDSMIYNALCEAHLQFQTISEDLIDKIFQARSRQALRAIDLSTGQDHVPRDPAVFKNLILDDVVEIQLLEGYEYVRRTLFGFLFKEHLMLCSTTVVKVDGRITPLMDHESLSNPYPVTSWDLGPALRSNETLCVSICIPLTEIKKVAIPEHDPSSLVFLRITQEKTEILSFLLKSPNQQFRWSWALAQAAWTLAPYPATNCQRHGGSESGAASNRNDEEYENECPESLQALFDGERMTIGSITNDIEDGGNIPIQLATALQPPSPSSLSETAQNKSPKTEVPDLTGQISKLGNYAVAGGGFADVWKCEWEAKGLKYTVAVKVLRGNVIEGDGEVKLKKRLTNEMEVWQGLSHKNIVPLWGVCTDFGKFASFICPWFDQGNLNRYLRRQATLPLSKKHKILFDIAAGLTYLHSFSIVHGDLTSANILIKETGEACITDFGLSRVAQDLMGSTYLTSVKPGAMRWAAPELFKFDSNDRQISTFSDIYSYGCVVFEVLSGLMPYYNLQTDVQVLFALHKRQKTPRPDISSGVRITDEMWDFINDCWSDSPLKRPSALDITPRLALMTELQSVLSSQST